MSQMENPSLGSFQVSAESSHGFVATPQNKKEREGETDQALGDPRPQAVCRFFSLGRHCNFGRKCRFLHVKGDGSTLLQGKLDNSSNMRPEQDKQKQPAGESQSDGLQQDIVCERPGVDRPSNPRAAPAKSKMPISRRPCRYYLSGFCSMEDRCRFFHPTQFPSVADQSMLGDESRPRQLTPAPKPSVLQEVKVAHLTEEIAQKLRDTEIKQMMKRFPSEQLIIQERSDCQVTFYRITVAATDPDWPFDLKEVDIMVSFPEKYPQEVFTLDIPLDQELPSVMGRHVQQASVDWLQAKHATNELMGKVELLLRPYLRWLDRSMERLFTEGARVLKKDMDVAKAGLQFVPYQQLQATVGKDPANPDMGTAADEVPPREVDEEDEENMEMRDPEIDPESDDEMEEDQGGLGQVEHIKPIEPRRGTELKLLGLRLGEDTATVVAQHITVCLQCNRCKVTADLSLSGRTPCTAQCEKCNAEIRAAFRPGMLHQYSDVLGHLDLSNAAAMDLVLQDCQLVVGCLGYSQESPVQGFSYGQAMLVNCEHCYSQLSILVESTRFQNIQPRLNKTGQDVSNLSSRLPFRDPAVQKGKPLPDKGICKHFKQSHRWLRFPCCGRAYPCDVCHDEDQDHPMELATRMICGHCAKEQMYSNGKACVGCGNMMTRGAHTNHWEGGLGCRNKVKMNRNDRHKYANTNKTVSRKAGSEK